MTKGGRAYRAKSRTASGAARFASTVAGLSLLAACAGTSAQDTGGSQNIYEQFGTVVLNSLGLADETPPDRPTPSRADLERIPAAVIAVSFDDFPRSFITPQSDADGYLNYRDQARRGLRVKGGAVAGTFGFGEDLRAVRHQREDPIARPTPLSAWPGQVDREYQYRQRDLFDYSVTVTCVYDRAVREQIEIIERRYEVVRVVETCTNARRSFENTYWVEPDTGFIWKSRQWTGPEIRPVIIEVIKPYIPA